MSTLESETSKKATSRLDKQIETLEHYANYLESLPNKNKEVSKQ